MVDVNATQVGGDHYGPGAGSYQHWDFMKDSGLDWCGGNATKYVARYWKKGSAAVDLQKAIHYLQKRSDQGYTSRLGSSIGLPYQRAAAMDAKVRWMEGGGVPEYEQGVITQIILGNNDQAIELIEKLLSVVDEIPTS